MSDEHKTRVFVLNESLYGEANTLAGWMEWLRERFDRVPEEYRDTAILEIDSVGGYEGEHHTEAEIYYSRPETDKERQQREAKHKARLEDDLRRHEQYAAQARAALQRS